MKNFEPLQFLIVIIGLLFIASCSADNPKIRHDTDTFYKTGIVFQEERGGSFLKVMISPLYDFHSNFISPIDNRKCIFTPTCSSYSRQVISKYGFIKGYVLTCSRLIRCNSSVFIKNRYPVPQNMNSWKAYDPVK